MNIQNITQQYLKLFPGDFSGNTIQRQTPKVLFSTVKPVGFQNPELILFNDQLSQEIGLGSFNKPDLDFLVGNRLPDSIQTYATAYAGHQFGNWAGQLGDGRAIYAGEITNAEGKITEIQWKGAGATPYSRFADGRAVLRSSVREYLISEAMHHLGVPTTRALSLCFTGEEVVRDMMYDGNPQAEKGAVIIRTAESFLRFGHFELLSAQKETATLQSLADFAIKNYFKEIDENSPKKYHEFFQKIAKDTADLMVAWFRVGFVHGVMNTDNMSILGLSIDYGPFSMMDDFDLNFTPNTTDLPGRRYAFGKQPQIAQWNLWQLANALFPLIKDAEYLEQTLDDFSQYFWQKHDRMMADKFGFEELLEEDANFFQHWQEMMIRLRMDYTLFFHWLEKPDEEREVSRFLQEVSYLRYESEHEEDLRNFLGLYEKRIAKNAFSREQSIALMKKNNPKFILRNYLLYECIEDLNNGNKEKLYQLWDALQSPYEEKHPEFFRKRPDEYDGTPGCSQLSCSS